MRVLDRGWAHQLGIVTGPHPVDGASWVRLLASGHSIGFYNRDLEACEFDDDNVAVEAL